jgi:hypothetical protein
VATHARFAFLLLGSGLATSLKQTAHRHRIGLFMRAWIAMLSWLDWDPDANWPGQAARFKRFLRTRWPSRDGKWGRWQLASRSTPGVEIADAPICSVTTLQYPTAAPVSLSCPQRYPHPFVMFLPIKMLITSKIARVAWVSGCCSGFLLCISCVNTEKRDNFDRVEGLVEVPGILGIRQHDWKLELPSKITPLKLYERPSRFSKVVGVISGRDDFFNKEYDYEASGAVVFARSGNLLQSWYYIRGGKVSGWLSSSDTARFYSYEVLVRDRSTYMTADWDRKLWDAPGFDQPCQRQRLPKRIEEDHPLTSCGVKVQDSRTVKGQLWFKVQLQSLSPAGPEWRGACGWVPAYDSQGAVNVWFFSRGC